VAKNRWYDPREDAYLRRRAWQLGVARQPYGRRVAVYHRLARELTRRFSVARSWQGIRQRLQRLARGNPTAG